ncbi:MAG: PH domain-containing protein [Bacteroidota bacterium]
MEFIKINILENYGNLLRDEKIDLLTADKAQILTRNGQLSINETITFYRANCTICDSSIGFMNKPNFGTGKLKDQTEICSKCFSRINNIDSSMIRQLKNMTSLELKDFLFKHEQAYNIYNQKLEIIKEQIKNLNLDKTSSLFGYKEINELPRILLENENVLEIVQGGYSGKIGILVATEQRLIFIDKGFVYGLKIEDFHYDKIISIQHETGLVHGKIVLTSAGNHAEISNVIKDRVKPFCDKVKMIISDLNKSQSSQNQNTNTNQAIDIADQLLKLANLKEKGILTEAEFQSQKIKLLSL